VTDSDLINSDLSPFADWHACRAEVEKLVGGRATDLLAWVVADASGDTVGAEAFRESLAASGTPVDNPDVTEAERLLLDWARQAATNQRTVDAGVQSRFDGSFAPSTREQLVRFTALTVATSVAHLVG
jgi:hypothetical protein